MGCCEGVLVAGLYPNLIRVDPGRHKFKTAFIIKVMAKLPILAPLTLPIITGNIGGLFTMISKELLGVFLSMIQQR